MAVILPDDNKPQPKTGPAGRLIIRVMRWWLNILGQAVGE